VKNGQNAYEYESDENEAQGNANNDPDK